MGKKIDEAVKNALVRAATWEARMAALDKWTNELCSSPVRRTLDSSIRMAMADEVLHAWRDAMLFGLILEDHRQEVADLAHSRFLDSRGIGKPMVMQYLRRDGQMPNIYATEAEEDLRKEISDSIQRVTGVFPKSMLDEGGEG